MPSPRPFQFYLPDGSIETNTNSDYLKNLGMDDEFIQLRQKQQKAHVVSEMYHERKWRNQQLQNALYIKGLQIVDTQMIDDYIEALKNYDLKYQPRPEPGQVLQQSNVFEDWLP